MKPLDKFNKLLKKKNRIGMDIGSYAIKAVELAEEKENLKIKNLAYEKIASPDSKECLVLTIKEAANKANALNKEINISVSGPSVIVRFIELPHMNPDELKNAIIFEAEKYIPFSITETIIDHQLLIPRFGDEKKMLVLLVAAKRDFIAERLGLLEEAGLSAGVLDVTSFANINAFLRGTKRRRDEITALVDIGAKATDINIIEQDILYFTRSIQIGGNDITKMISDAFAIDLKSAENLKINPGDKESEFIEKVNPVLNNIVDEIQLSFSYYENQSGKNIERVYLTGGSSRIMNFYNVLREGLGVEALPWDPIGDIKLDPSIDNKTADSIKDQLGVAIGLALR